jgi:hypothetical protein
LVSYEPLFGVHVRHDAMSHRELFVKIAVFCHKW